MKLPSLELLKQSILTTVLRFPLALVAAVIGTLCVMLLVENKAADVAEHLFQKMLMTASLGLPLFFAVQIFCERSNMALWQRWALHMAGVGALVGYFILLPAVTFEPESVMYRYAALSMAMHLLVAFSAFYVYSEVNGFWQFNKLLFLRFLTAALYSSVLYLGLAGALLAVDNLFNINVDGTLYAHLWIFIAGLFNTAFFLGGIPAPVTGLLEETAYPRGLKIFTQYVLVPLVMIYLLILYAYMLKIGIAWSLPKGWVANLILGFSVAGTLSLLLVWPIREQESNGWIKAFSRFYYVSLVPLIVLLFVAIGKRIHAYGFTIERYIVFVLGVWLAVITLYFLFSKRKNIIVIPVLLFVFLMLGSFGPWSMFGMSERSQMGRLQALLVKNGTFENGKIRKLTADEATKVNYEDVAEITSILYYLEQNHTLAGVAEWITDSCALSAYELEDCLGFSSNVIAARSYAFNFYCEDNREDKGIHVTGYDRIYKLYADNYDDVENNTNALIKNKLRVFDADTLVATILLDSVMAALIKHPNDGNALSEEQMTFALQSEAGKAVELQLREISIDKDEDAGAYKVITLNGYVLTKD